jgi:hypothetical protein
MPKLTLTELVREQARSIAILEEQVKGIEVCRDSDKRMADDPGRLTTDVAVVREKVGAIEKNLDQITQRRWTLVVAVVSAFVGGILTLLIQFSLRALPK